MSEFWKDRVAQPLEGAPDGDSYYDLVDTGGEVKVQGVKLRLKNELVEPGTPVNAANLTAIESRSDAKIEAYKTASDSAMSSFKGDVDSRITHFEGAVNNQLGSLQNQLTTGLRASLAAYGTTAGSGVAYTLTYGGFALADLATVRVKLHADMEEGATLNVSGTGPKPIYSGEEPTGEGLKAGEICQLSYNATNGRWYLTAGGGGGMSKFKFPTYTGDYATYGDTTQGYMTLLSSGTFTAISDMVVDVFMVGGGQSGSTSTYNGNGGGGGGGGYTQTLRCRSLAKNTHVDVIIGAGGVRPATGNGIIGAAGSATLFGGERAESGGSFPQHSYTGGGRGGSGGGGGGSTNPSQGGNGGSNGSGGTAGANPGGSGQDTSTYAFEGDCAPFDSMLYAGGGGGGGRSYPTQSRGGDGGGGLGGAYQQNGGNALPNTGGGGGGGGGGNNTSFGSGGDGGSGIVIVRWGYENAAKASAGAQLYSGTAPEPIAIEAAPGTQGLTASDQAAEAASDIVAPDMVGPTAETEATEPLPVYTSAQPVMAPSPTRIRARRVGTTRGRQSGYRDRGDETFSPRKRRP